MKLICITPVDQIAYFKEKLINNFETSFLINASKNDLKNYLLKEKSEIVFTNPNQQSFILDKNILDNTSIKIICTASTGLNHIDIEYCLRKNIKVISITREIETLRKITSTAELAFCLLLSSVRNLIVSNDSVRKGNWSWEPFIGRQINSLNIGIVGYGRLGTMFANYSKSFGAKIFVYDPYIDFIDGHNRSQTLEDIFKVCDAVSLHVHASKETHHMINEKVLKLSKEGLILINTSRGEIVNEKDIRQFLENGKIKHYACDVLENEFSEKVTSSLFGLSKEKVTFTPHIGGSTIDAQKIAYNKVLEILIEETRGINEHNS